MDIEAILVIAFEKGASDIHLVSGEPPIIRVDTGLILLDQPILSSEEMKQQVSMMLSEQQLEKIGRAHV